MKGDFSRIRFNPSKQYTAVLEQQGRVSLDADANEQCAIDGYLRTTETVDVVGEYGAPVHDAGFEITVEQNEILIGAGRYYVEGLLCENHQDKLPYGSQPCLINPSPADSALLADLVQQGGSIQVFLQVWQRLVTALDDPCLLEPALGQADTTARLQTIWRVVADLVPPAGSSGGNRGSVPGPVRPAPPTGLLSSARSALSSRAALKASAVTSAFTAKKNLRLSSAALGGSIAGPAAAGPAAGSASPINLEIDCCTQMYAEKTAASTGAMAAATSQGSSDCSCEPIPAAGYRGLENQLYRVEIHLPGDETSATLKWSRENGSVVVSIKSVNGPTVWVDTLGPDANLGFQAGAWVEISDDSSLFGQTPNQPGMLYQILSVDPTGPSITMTTPVVPVDPARYARARRWEQSGPSAGSYGLPLPVNSWLTLENGIQVSFNPGAYQTGDYWTIPARAASGLIDWPPCGSDGNLFQPPRSITVYNAPLACIHWDKRKRQVIVDPCRRIFYPLTELTPPATPPALHITNYSWQNDDVMTFDQLLKTGLTLTLDQAPTGPVSGASFIVTVEAFNTSFASSFNRALAVSPADAAPASATTSPAANLLLSSQAFSVYTALLQTLPRSPFILDWQTSVNTKAMQITWGLPETDLTGLQFRYLEVINNNLLGLFAEYGLLARARVQLLGREIFSQSGATQAFLDGQCFGSPATRQDGKTPCIALQMPSGNGEKASDFEGWFYLAPFNNVSQLNINFAAFTVVVDALGAVTGVVAGTPPQAVTPQITVMLAYPAATVGGVTVSFVLSATTAGINANSYVSLQAPTLTIPQGSSQGTLNLNFFGNPGAGNTYSFQVTASVELAYGTAATQSVTFTLTGVQAPIGFVGRTPINFNQ